MQLPSKSVSETTQAVIPSDYMLLLAHALPVPIATLILVCCASVHGWQDAVHDAGPWG